MTLLARETFDIVIPCSDPAIIFLDANRDALAHQRLASRRAHTMGNFYDKEQTRSMAERLGIPVSPAHRLSEADTADSLLARYGLPLVLKPRRTFFAGSDQAREIVEIVESRDELVAVLSTIKDRSRYLAEAFFVGDGVGVSVLANKGSIIQSFQHRRLREERAAPVRYRISETVDPLCYRPVRASVPRWNTPGSACLNSVTTRRAARESLIETNARFWGSMGLPLSLGLDYPNMLYQLLVEGTVPPRSHTRPASEAGTSCSTHSIC